MYLNDVQQSQAYMDFSVTLTCKAAYFNGEKEKSKSDKRLQLRCVEGVLKYMTIGLLAIFIVFFEL